LIQTGNGEILAFAANFPYVAQPNYLPPKAAKTFKKI
jgi:hypothetical protein